MANEVETIRPYTHTAQSNEALVALMLSRGLMAEASELSRVLAAVGYYRLKGYLVPFYQPKTEVFKSGTRLEDVWSVYVFDRYLRETALNAIARLEVAMRARIIRVMCAANPDPLAYTRPEAFGKLTAIKHAELLVRIAKCVRQSRNEPFLAHARKVYGFEDLPPIWTMMEVLPFGTLMDFFNGLSDELQIKIADEFHVRPSVLDSWFALMRKVRNVCAHHGRLWNRRLQNPLSRKIGSDEALKPLAECLSAQAAPSYSNIFTALSVVCYCLGIVRPESQWKTRCKKLLHEATPFVLRGMGVPENWEELALWKD